MNQISLADMANDIIAQMPPSTRFNDEDARLLFTSRKLLLSLESKVVQGFYDTLFAHPPTRAIFSDHERPAREQTLRTWWRRTIRGPFDDKYWQWQALVGLIHIKRKVKNPMMIGMWGWLLTILEGELEKQLSSTQVRRIMDSFKRLAATVQALTAESYLENYLSALCEATAFPPNLLDRFVDTQVNDLLKAMGRG